MIEKDQYSMPIISDVKDEFSDVFNLVKNFSEKYFVYVSVNKTEEGMKKLLEKNKIKTEKIYFIDCFSSDKEKNKIYINPKKLDSLFSSIKKFAKSIKEEEIVIIDSLSSLAIYNSENDVAKFIKKTIEEITKDKGKLIVFTQKTNEDLIGMVHGFFDKVVK